MNNKEDVLRRIEYKYRYILNSQEEIKIIKDNEESFIEIFLARVYCNFFLFNISEKSEDLNTSMLDFLQNFLKVGNESPNIPKELLLDITEKLGFNGISEAYLFPFIESEYIPYYPRIDSNLDIINYISKFKTTHYSYICCFKFNGKMLILTDIKEDKIHNSFSTLGRKGYSILEFHKVIPRLIDVLKDKIIENQKDGNKENLINEIGIGFPLSMIGNHALIKTTLKEYGSISSDENFKKLIRFGVLNYFKIKLDYKISFNDDNQRNKFSLNGFLCPRGRDLNKILLGHLNKFLLDIDGIKHNTGDFLNLPIYTISGKYSYKDESMFPYFNYNETDENLNITITSETSKGIEGSFIINGIFPQYVKIDGDNVAYLRAKELFIINDINNFEIEYFKNNSGDANCKDFLHNYLNLLNKGYSYIWDKNEGDEYIREKNEHNGPNFLIGDLYLTAIDENNGDYLINISDSKKDNSILTIEIYRLSYNGFGRNEIEQLTKQFPGNELNYLGSLELDGKISSGGKIMKSVMAKYDITDYNKKYQCILKKEYSLSVNGSPGKYLGYKKPDYFKEINYIEDYLKEEDIVSLLLIKLLEKKGHSAFFGGKSKLIESRELADIISIEENIVNKEINLNLFHIKIKPFKQASFSQLEAGYSQYTEVVGQMLEKVQSFIDKININGILSEIEGFFKTDTGISLNHIIYENIEKILQGYSKEKILNINIFFPVRKKDYFPDELGNVNLKELAIFSNWKRLKMINDVFKSNVDNINIPGLNLKLNLGILICERIGADNLGINNNLYLVNRIDELFNNI